jgi:hypothetical protein
MEGGASNSFNITGSSSATIADADYLYLDPKLPRGGSGSKPAGMSKVAFQEAFVFVVGGGNYVEYQNLQELTQVLY